MLAANVFEFLGFLFLFVVSFKVFRSLCRGLYQCYLAPILGMTLNFKEMGKWAVITGSTDGIGKAYAEELAKRGLNIILISRSPDKLKAVAEEIEKKYVVKTKVISVDFTGGLEIYDTIREGLDGHEIGVLVNNVGMSYVYPEYLSIIPDGDKVILDVIKANTIACTMMMRLILPDMEKRRRGVIINIASISAVSPVPLLTVYGASKVYMDFLSRGAQIEFRDKGIMIQSVLPGFVVSNMSRLRKSWSCPYPKEFVQAALCTVGIEDRTYGYPAHKLMGYALEVLMLYFPSSILDSVNYNVSKGIRRGYYKKHGLLNSSNQAPKTKEN